MTKAIVEMKLDAWQEREDLIVALIKERDALIDALKEARAALKEARDDVEDWGAYASAYFQEKHDLKGCLARIDAALNKFPADEPPVGGQSNAAPIKGDKNEKTFASDNAPRRAWINPNS